MHNQALFRTNTTLLPLSYDTNGLNAIVGPAGGPASDVAEAALAAERAGLFATASEHWRQVIRIHPDLPEARWRLAEALRQDGDADGARAALRKALVLQPDHAQAALRLGEMLIDAGETVDGLTWLKRIMGRRPEDEALRVTVLGVCARAGLIGQVRVLGERMIGEPGTGARLSAALAFVFLGMGDHGRALEAAMAGLSRSDAPAAHGLLAADLADRAENAAEASRILARLVDQVPSGVAVGRRARAQADAGDADGAAVTIGSALLRFHDAPDHLSDMALLLAAPRHARLRGVLVNRLETEASADGHGAAAALALIHYRLGQWREASGIAAAMENPGAHRFLAIAAENMRKAATALPGASGRMPEDAFAAQLFRAPRPVPECDPARQVMLFDRHGWSGRQRSLLEIARLAMEEAAFRPSILQRAPDGLDATGCSDAAFLAASLTGVPDYAVINPGDLDEGAAEAASPVLGYLPPRMAAEVEAFRAAIAAQRPVAVHIASANMAVSGGLAALLAGAPRIFLHAGPDWLSDGPEQDRAFLDGLTFLARQPVVRIAAGSEAGAERLAAALTPKRPPKVMPPALDSRGLRHRSGGRERGRAAELLGLAEGEAFLSVFGDKADIAAIGQALASLPVAERPARTVLWRHRATRAASESADADTVRTLRWPVEPAHYLAHARLALAVGADESHRLTVLQHIVMDIPVLLADSPDLEDLATAEGVAIALDAAGRDGLQPALSRWLADGAERRQWIEQAAARVRRGHKVGRALRSIRAQLPKKV